ncbi:tRNA1(Val) (adenine(37)-N6)-methyltransferase [Microvirga antarctica]|uniref:tRNA1(Val) (adenine(37)-N6)-methyltransferase n=1 Tax=Microvirga antarctica TaxID=2819233 RepID=UPI001B3060D3|nr:methyltransferase [Microvirga antarctica]
MIDVTDDSLLGGRVALRQPARGHRAGTDAVLLAAAAGAQPGDTIVDAGAATGAVGLMVASRVPAARYVFVERDPDLARLCGENCRTAGLGADVIVADLLDRVSRQSAGLLAHSADLVLTNPPFLEEGQSRISPDARRAAAHALPAGGLEFWLKASLSLLRPKGRLVLIHRADRLDSCLSGLAGRLGGLAIRFVHPQADKPAIRVILSGIVGSRAPLSVLPPVILNDAAGRFTPAAEALHRGEATLS